MKKLLVAASIVNVIAAFYFFGCFVGGIVDKGLDAWHMAYYKRNGYPRVVYHYTQTPRLEGAFGMYSTATF